jgi:hypothetical protein
MPDHQDVIVTLTPSFVVTNQPAGKPSKFLVRVPKGAMEKHGLSSTQSSIARDLAMDAALKAHAARFSTDSKIRFDIHTQLLVPGWSGRRALQQPAVFNECSVWTFTEENFQETKSSLR